MRNHGKARGRIAIVLYLITACMIWSSGGINGLRYCDNSFWDVVGRGYFGCGVVRLVHEGDSEGEGEGDSPERSPERDPEGDGDPKGTATAYPKATATANPNATATANPKATANPTATATATASTTIRTRLRLYGYDRDHMDTTLSTTATTRSALTLALAGRKAKFVAIVKAAMSLDVVAIDSAQMLPDDSRVTKHESWMY